MSPQELSALQEALHRSSASWTAQHNPLLDLSHEQRILRLGFVPGAGERSLQEREQAATAGLAAHMAALAAPAAAAAALPSKIDWRAHNGHNYISAVKDQGNCGSCVSFGTSALIDGAMRIAFNGPIGTPAGHKLQDVSEAQLFYCSNVPPTPHTCSTGWNVPPALAYATHTGVAPESCFPYTAGDQPCNLCHNWATLVTQVKNSSALTNAAAMKNWLATKGPLACCFSVYDDFFSYHSGVYVHHSGALDGGHCVCCIGYDDTHKAWLCKNSWGPTWGMGGYFFIGYGQCGIDSEMWGIESFAKIYHT